MFIQDLFEFGRSVPDGYRDEKSDENKLRLKDTRTTRLTLAQIKQLRQMNDLKKFEKVNDTKQLAKQYKPAAQPAAAMQSVKII